MNLGLLESHAPDDALVLGLNSWSVPSTAVAFYSAPQTEAEFLAQMKELHVFPEGTTLVPIRSDGGAVPELGQAFTLMHSEDREVEVLVAARALREARHIALRSSLTMPEAGMLALIEATPLLEVLDVRDNKLGDTFFRRMLESPSLLAHLRGFRCHRAQTTEEIVGAIMSQRRNTFWQIAMA